MCPAAVGQTRPMARWRLAVALMLSGPVAAEIDGLRRGLGDRQLGVIGPHVTLVPPINVAAADVPSAIAGVRAAASARTGPLALHLGPVRTFAPANRVLYLAVEPLADVRAVREVLRREPFDRPDLRPFVPHVTVDIDAAPDRLDAGLAALADFAASTRVEGVSLLRERRDDERGRHWTPVADARFGRTVVVGRGGIELAFTAGTLIDPATTALLPSGTPPRHDLVVTACRAGAPVGVAAARWAGADLALVQFLVAPDERGLGVGRALIAETASMAAAAGAASLIADGTAAEVLGDFLVGHGWSRADVLRRRLD